MIIFKRIKNYFQDIKINLDFEKFEIQCRKEHEKQAAQQFSTKEISEEKNHLLAKIKSQASEKFDEPLNSKQAKINELKEKEKNIRELLSFFERNYKQELDELYLEKNDLFEKKNALREALSKAFENKKEAYNELNRCKEAIDSWYEKSDRTPWLFGNAGKELPKHSLFGQSFGDLESYKSDRDDAYNDIQDVKNQIANLKQEQHDVFCEIEEIKNQIDQVKSDRSNMYNLKKQHNKEDLQNQLNGLQFSINKLSTQVQEILKTKESYIYQEKIKCDFSKLEEKINEIKNKKIQYIESFELEKNKQKRKQMHREMWLKQNA